MQRTIISAIITTHNREEMVCDAVEHVLVQTRPADEVIVVDDGSTDDTLSRLTRFGSRIRCITTENRGISHARNTGIEAARGDFIAFCDSDDLWMPEKLERQHAMLCENPDYYLVHSDEIWIRSGKRINQKARHRKQGGWIFEPSLHLCLVSPSSAMIHRHVFRTIGHFDEQLIVCEDYDFWLRTAHTYPFLFCEQPLIIKRGGHADQLSRRYWGMDRFRIMSLLKILAIPDLTLDERCQVLRVLAGKARIIADGCSIRGKVDDTAYYRSVEDSAEAQLAACGERLAL